MSVNNGINARDARHENTVKPLYQDETVAKKYIENRFNWSWSRKLHLTQAAVINDAIARHNLDTALELAPGPARLTTEVTGINEGLMIEASAEMIDVARARLAEKKLGDIFSLAAWVLDTIALCVLPLHQLVNDPWNCLLCPSITFCSM